MKSATNSVASACQITTTTTTSPRATAAKKSCNKSKALKTQYNTQHSHSCVFFQKTYRNKQPTTNHEAGPVGATNHHAGAGRQHATNGARKQQEVILKGLTGELGIIKLKNWDHTTANMVEKACHSKADKGHQGHHLNMIGQGRNKQEVGNFFRHNNLEKAIFCHNLENVIFYKERDKGHGSSTTTGGTTRKRTSQSTDNTTSRKGTPHHGRDMGSGPAPPWRAAWRGAPPSAPGGSWSYTSLCTCCCSCCCAAGICCGCLFYGCLCIAIVVIIIVLRQ